MPRIALSLLFLFASDPTFALDIASGPFPWPWPCQIAAHGLCVDSSLAYTAGLTALAYVGGAGLRFLIRTWAFARLRKNPDANMWFFEHLYKEAGKLAIVLLIGGGIGIVYVLALLFH